MFWLTVQCLSPPSPPLVACFGVGDLNDDGVLDISDLVILSNFILGLDGLDVDECRADVDSDGTVNISVSSVSRDPQTLNIANVRLLSACGLQDIVFLISILLGNA